MADKSQRAQKEKKKPKADKDKTKQVSAYKAALSGGGPSLTPGGKKN